MNINIKPPTIPKLPDTLPAEAMVFPLLCGYHSYQDYKKAPQETKSQTLVMRSFVLAGTTIGIFAGYKTLSKILEKNKRLQIDQIKKDTISSIGVPLGGIAGGFVTGSMAESFYSFVMPKTKKSPQEIKKSDTSHLLKNTEIKKEKKLHSILKNIGIILFTIAGAALGSTSYMKIAAKKAFKDAHYTKFTQKAMNIGLIATGALTGLLAGDTLLNKEQSELNKKTMQNADFFLTELNPTVSAFDSVSDNNLKNRIKNGFFEVVSSVVIPSSIVLPALYFLRNFIKDDKKFDKHFGFLRHVSTNRITQKMIFEKSISIPLAVGTYYAGNYIGDLVDKKITQKVLEQKFWEDIEKHEQQSIKDLKDGVEENNPAKLKKALDDLTKIQEISQEVRTSQKKET